MICHTSLYDVRLRRYWVFSDSTPITPGAPLDSPAFAPHTSTPLSCSSPKLNQRRPQIRPPFCPSSSHLGFTAPAPFRSLFGAQASCCQDALLSSSLWASHRGQHCTSSAVTLFICFSLEDDAWSHDQNCHGGALGDKPGKIVNLRNLRSSFWFFVLGLEGHIVVDSFINKHRPRA